MDKAVIFHPHGETPVPLTCVSVHPRGNRAVCGTADGRIIIVSAKNGRPQRAIHGHESLTSSVAFIGAGSQVVSGAWDATLRLWDVSSGRPLGTLRCDSDVKALSVDSAGKSAIVGCRDGSAGLLHIEPFTMETVVVSHQTSVTAMAMSRSGSHSYVASWSGNVVALKTERLAPLATAHVASSRIRAMALDPSDSVLFVGLQDGRLLTADPDSLHVTGSEQAHASVLSALALSDDGRLLLSGGWDRTVCLWSTRPLKCLERHSLDTGVTAATWAQRVGAFLTTDFAGALTLWMPS